MDVRLAPEQRALRDSAAQVVDRHGPGAIGELDDPERVAKLDAAIASAGWRELRTPTDDGEPWASGVEVAIVAEELGRGRADAAFLGPTLAAELRRLAGAPTATSPETVAFASNLAEPACAVDGGLPAGSVALDGLGASAALVLMPAGGGYALGRVGVPQGRVPPVRSRLDVTRPTPLLDPAPVADPLPGQARVVEEADLAGWTALGLATTSADLVGTMRGAVDLACDYARERRQFGKPIGSFQAIQHLLADALVAVEGSRSVALHAAWAVDALAPGDALAAGAVAKAYCARAARSACETAIQVHGGIGHTWECLAHVHLRRSLLASDVLGGVGASVARVLDHHGIGGGRGLP
jgi:alkylation response protein AidB-like acyl-CoA dehydrogenase